ncbi:ASCH domain-containing protein [Vibrio astriarenae]|uniref:ASCH domain-containing protein n=1 Tax=Vibrio astriarenae TaxID=1481923 RepID=UPI0037357812
MDERSQRYLETYLSQLPAQTRSQYTSFSSDYYCADKHNADLCAQLVKTGQKTATCSLAHWYLNEDEPMPKIGHLQVVTDWDGLPHCIIEITQVETCRYCDVTPEFAAAEGEGDKTLRWWREAHWAFFARECEELGIEPNEEMPLILERFRVVYDAPFV